MSSAILYLAIIAIWAGFLVPAWVRRPHAAPEHSPAENDVVNHHEQAQGYAGEPPAYADAHYAAASGAYETGASRASVSGPSRSRGQMLQARRRMLTILVAMTLVTVGFAYLGLVKWWICVPPAGVLVVYVLLLREMALADADFARKYAAWEVAQARAYAQYMQAEAEREAYEANVAESSAQIIDISGRVSDQLYDQYADAAVRAVGD